jgi:hypothetical protein
MFGFNQQAIVGKRRRQLFQDGYEDITYKQVNNYVIQQFMLMTKLIKEYERQNQLYMCVLLNCGTRLENHPKDNVLRS